MSEPQWIPTWACALVSQSILDPIPDPEPSHARFENTTLRQTVRFTLGAETIRIRFSNLNGSCPLRITRASVGVPVEIGTNKAGLEVKSVKPLTFNGSESGEVSPGGEEVSDPIDYPVSTGGDLTISIYLRGGQAETLTMHDMSLCTTFLAEGDQTSSTSLGNAKPTPHWFFLSRIETLQPERKRVLVCVGDSITDGHGADLDQNNRYPDWLFRRMVKAQIEGWGVLNLGIAGGRLLLEGFGPSLLDRFEREVLSQPGLTAVAVLIGVNDMNTVAAGLEPGEDVILAQEKMYLKLVKGYENLIARTHAKGVKICFGTILPFSSPNDSGDRQASQVTWRKINAWIRGNKEIDYVADYAKAVASEERDDRLRKECDSGDYVHPSGTGFEAMAGAWDLRVFKRFEE